MKLLLSFFASPLFPLWGGPCRSVCVQGSCVVQPMVSRSFLRSPVFFRAQPAFFFFLGTSPDLSPSSLFRVPPLREISPPRTPHLTMAPSPPGVCPSFFMLFPVDTPLRNPPAPLDRVCAAVPQGCPSGSLELGIFPFGRPGPSFSQILLF